MSFGDSDSLASSSLEHGTAYNLPPEVSRHHSGSLVSQDSVGEAKPECNLLSVANELNLEADVCRCCLVCCYDHSDFCSRWCLVCSHVDGDILPFFSPRELKFAVSRPSILFLGVIFGKTRMGYRPWLLFQVVCC